ncbi:unnamed protein product, partial [Prorocentrum cordatum]
VGLHQAVEGANLRADPHHPGSRGPLPRHRVAPAVQGGLPGKTVRLASASADSRVNLWCLTESQPLNVLEGHEDDRVNRVVFHPMGEHLVSTSHDMSWRLWDIATSTELLLQERPLAAHLRGRHAPRRLHGGHLRPRGRRARLGP